MKNIRLGLIGCGAMMDSHAAVIQQVDGITFTAMCDVNMENAKRVADALGTNPYLTTDYKTMVDHVDAVLVALPHDLHYECGIFFAHHKKHIFMEKPLCNSEEECLRLIQVCEDEKVVLMCGYPCRYEPGVVKLKELVDSGDYGRIMTMSIWTEQHTEPAEGDWGATARLGGGQFFSHGCHYVDLLLWFLGNPLKGSHFGTRVGTPFMLREGTSMATMKFENGAIGYHGATWGAKGTKLGYEYQIMTEKGLIAYHYRDREIRLYDKWKEHKPGDAYDYPYTVLWQSGKELLKETNFEIEHFVDCVNNGKRPLTDGRSALQSLRVIWKMYDAEKFDIVADLRGLGLDEAYTYEKAWVD